MTIEVNVKFNVGDKVTVKKPLGVAAYFAEKDGTVAGTVIGYVIHKTKDRTQVYYKVCCAGIGCENKKYQAANLELCKEN